MFFGTDKAKVRRLEPKWLGHFGNYIDNTLLALHEFQAKKQTYIHNICIYIYVCVWVMLVNSDLFTQSSNM